MRTLGLPQGWQFLEPTPASSGRFDNKSQLVLRNKTLASGGKERYSYNHAKWEGVRGRFQARLPGSLRARLSAEPEAAQGELPYKKGWQGGDGCRSAVKRSGSGAQGTERVASYYWLEARKPTEEEPATKGYRWARAFLSFRQLCLPIILQLLYDF